MNTNSDESIAYFREVRRREQRLAEAISQGSPGDAAPEALLNALRAKETRRKRLEDQLATLPQPTTVVSVDRDRVARELRTRADDMQNVLRRRGAQAREALRTLLVDRDTQRSAGEVMNP